MKSFYIILLIITFSSLHIHAQDKQQNKEAVAVDTAYNAKYNKFKALYLKKIQSESYIKYTALHKAFNNKLHADDNIVFDSNFTRLNYVKANLTNTDFASYEIAEKEWEACVAARIAEWKENKATEDYMSELLMWGNIQNAEIIEQVMRDVTFEKREKNN